MISKIWNQYLGRNVKLLIDDKPYPRMKTGMVIDIDNTHIFLKVNIKGEEEIKPFLLSSIKRLDLND